MYMLVLYLASLIALCFMPGCRTYRIALVAVGVVLIAIFLDTGSGSCSGTTCAGVGVAYLLRGPVMLAFSASFVGTALFKAHRLRVQDQRARDALSSFRPGPF